MKKLTCILLLAGLSYACSEKKDEHLEKAAKIHNEATQMAEEIEVQIESIDSLQTLLTEKKKTLTDASAIAAIDSASAALTTVAKAFEDWESNIIEVPGMVHEHHEGEHHHEHKAAPNVTSEQMVELQAEMKTNIEKIKADLTNAEAMLKKVL